MTPLLSPEANESDAASHALIRVRGAVQGVGFRPFVYRLARELGLAGNVRNSADGVVIEAHGSAETMDEFVRRIESERPVYSFITAIEVTAASNAQAASGFEIGASLGDGAASALIVPDLAPCPECLAEIFDPENRRHRYPFTNCTHCGPRFTIIKALPYDRKNTTMRGFRMCPECEREYDAPNDRRFHAQPNACPRCGPQMALWSRSGTVLAERDEALWGAAEALRSGRILAVKGVGGFQLLAKATDDGAVKRLRLLKNRPDKALAVMYWSVADIEKDCGVSSDERALLQSAAAPIVLLRRRKEAQLAASVAPRNPNVGAMLPHSPMHHLLLADLGFPVVATSGNLSDEPICTDEIEALARLGRVADLFLVHNRPIERHVDDSVVRVVLGEEMVLRRARGYAPLPIRLAEPVAATFAGGAYLKNCVAFGSGNEVFLSQHIGDLGNPHAIEAFKKASSDLPRLYGAVVAIGACDSHPDFPSTCLVSSNHARVVKVQHHYAHVLSCLAEHGLATPVLGVCWDGSGLGDDGTLWGGEFLRVDNESYERIAHLRTFPLPGGDAAAREPRRCALGAQYEALGAALFTDPAHRALDPFTSEERSVLRSALTRGLNSPVTSSAGRIFDAAASLMGLCHRATFEGQAAMELEAIADPDEQGAYPFSMNEEDTLIVDWQPTLKALLEELSEGVPQKTIAARFHNALVNTVVAVARKVGLRVVVLSGGCFQNVLLLTNTVQRLRGAGFEPRWPQRVPINDGGIALGQIVGAAWATRSLAAETT
ncbi:MAG TPA: carbamoyltransferase HypF [Opitutaceae bacterium]|nr:carbamoyltransferase HypF [Opitutaceae bacterium]